MDDKYQMIIAWSEKDGAYVATLPDLPGCAADGRTRQEAVANAERVIQEWIETAKELGRPVPRVAPMQETRKRDRRLGGAIGKLTIVEDDDAHLEDFREYMPGDRNA
jgi:predicted RNase H-like HicB family nuclease